MHELNVSLESFRRRLLKFFLSYNRFLIAKSGNGFGCDCVEGPGDSLPILVLILDELYELAVVDTRSDSHVTIVSEHLVLGCWLGHAPKVQSGMLSVLEFILDRPFVFFSPMGSPVLCGSAEPAAFLAQLTIGLSNDSIKCING